MVEFSRPNVEDALQISLVNVYTWKTQYSSLIPEEIIDERVENVYNSAKKTKARIEQDKNFFVAKVDGTVVGFCRYGKAEKEENTGAIYALYVLKGFKGMKIGKTLFNLAVDELKKMGYTKMSIRCLKGNDSLNFYKHMGGTVIGEDEMILPNGYALQEDVLIYDI